MTTYAKGAVLDMPHLLQQHADWLKDPSTGNRLDLVSANLAHENLSGATLRDAVLTHCNLSAALLVRANLYGAVIRHCDLRGANLQGCNLSKAVITTTGMRETALTGSSAHSAYMRAVDLADSHLCGATFMSSVIKDSRMPRCNLRGANFIDCLIDHTSLQDSDLRFAHMSTTKLTGSSMKRANIEGASFDAFQIPDGDLVGWKAIRGLIVELLIPREARRTANIMNRKCRAEYAVVVRVHGDSIGPIGSRSGCLYQEGHRVTPDSYDDDIRLDCAHGIHFFLTKEEAEQWRG